MKKLLAIVVLLFIAFQVSAQARPTEEELEEELPKFYLAPGLGIEHGGIGLNASLMAQKHFAIFGGLGYNFIGAGGNFGVRGYLTQHGRRIRPYFQAMYGYNTVLLIPDAKQYQKVFYGPTIGFGIDMKTGYYNTNYWTLALNYPIRGKEVDDYMNSLKYNHGIVFDRGLRPIAFSVGYRFGITPKR